MKYIIDKSILGIILANLSGFVAHREEQGKTYIKIMIYPTYCKAKFAELGITDKMEEFNSPL